MLAGQDAVEQRRFARAKESGQDDDRCFFRQVCGGCHGFKMCAVTAARKIS
jgi:hypothetical protein